MEIGSATLSLLRTGATAMFDAMGSTFPKAAVATLEDKSQSKVHLATQCLIDEGPEVFWKTVVGSLFVKASRVVTPFIPEQFANIPGELTGAFIHWWSASDGSKNNETMKIVNGSKSRPDFLQSIFNNYIKPAISSVLQAVGLNEKDNNVSFKRFFLLQAGLVGAGSLILRGAEHENIPGMNMDPEDPKWKTFLKIAGYTVLEQTTHLASQSARYYHDFKKEFNVQNGKTFSKDMLAKAIANAVHERAIPGNILSAISGCLSTLWLSKYIPKAIAGAIGEAPMKGLERLLTLHLRRSTKQRFDLKTNKIVDNYRIDPNGSYKKFLDMLDRYAFNPVRNFIVNIVARIFKAQDRTIEEYVEELRDTFNVKKDVLEKRAKGEVAVGRS